MKQILLTYTDEEYNHLMWLLKQRYNRKRAPVRLLKMAIDEVARQEAETVVAQTVDGTKSDGQ